VLLFISVHSLCLIKKSLYRIPRQLIGLGDRDRSGLRNTWDPEIFKPRCSNFLFDCQFCDFLKTLTGFRFSFVCLKVPRSITSNVGQISIENVLWGLAQFPSHFNRRVSWRSPHNLFHATLYFVYFFICLALFFPVFVYINFLFL